jgi:hypothetical protein
VGPTKESVLFSKSSLNISYKMAKTFTFSDNSKSRGEVAKEFTSFYLPSPQRACPVMLFSVRPADGSHSSGILWMTTYKRRSMSYLGWF